MSRVFVVDKERRPLAPCTPRRARLLLSECKASVLRRYPFTIILKESHPTASPRPLRLKIYPASKTTGLAVINESTAEVIWAAEIKHRSQQIKKALESKAGDLYAVADAIARLATDLRDGSIAPVSPLCFLMHRGLSSQVSGCPPHFSIGLK